MLINSLLAHASDTHWEEFISELERLDVRRAVVVCGILLPCNNNLIFPATDVYAHHRGFDVLHLGFSSQYDSSDISQEDNTS